MTILKQCEGTTALGPCFNSVGVDSTAIGPFLCPDHAGTKVHRAPPEPRVKAQWMIPLELDRWIRARAEKCGLSVNQLAVEMLGDAQEFYAKEAQ